MIDFDLFWGDPVPAAGLGGYLMSFLPDFIQKKSAGVTPKQIEAWERMHGVTLPTVLREALGRRNGGYLRDCRVCVLPLDDIKPPDKDFWQFTEYEEGEIADQKLLLHFAWEDETGGGYYLNFNAHGPRGEPSVYIYFSDPGDLTLQAATLAEFFDKLLAAGERPEVDWTEAATLQVLARETINVASEYGQAQIEQVLGRKGGALILLTHLRAGAEEEFTRLSLPEPLTVNAVMGGGAIRRRRPDPGGTFALLLQPRDTAGIVQVESKRTTTGKWKNTTQYGVPLYGMFESPDRDGLETLRQRLFGDQKAEQVRAAENTHDELQRRLAALPPEAQKAASMAMFLQGMEQVRNAPGMGPLDPVEMPPELREAAERIKGMLDNATRQARDEVAANPLDPELRRLMGEVLRQPPPDEAE